jgi:Na+/H+ antiporter NhaC
MLASVIFVIGAGLSLATGSSWGTFAVIIPIVVTTAFALDAPVAVCLGAALSGGLFGDHTSPISDTTVLSSMASGVNHISHVETQFPYAMITATLSFVGFMLASLLAQGSTGMPYIPVLIMAGMAGIAYFLLSRSRLAVL